MSEKVWLITGCSAGFGRAIADEAKSRGDVVIETARKPAIGQKQLDVTDSAQVERVVREAIEEHGRIDVVVNNAGHGSVGAVEELTLDELRSIMDVMFFGAVAVTKAVLPHLRERGRGHVVQISSMGGQVTMPGFGAYCAAKFALEAISESLAAEVGPLGVAVTIVEPGAFRTEFGGRRMHKSQVIAAYASTTGPTRAAVETMDGTQPGDPAKAARAIVDAVYAPEPPLRLALGDDAVDAIAAKHRELSAELARWEKISRATAAG